MARAYAHLTPRYIKDRLLVIFDERRNPQNPWLTAEAVHLLDQLVKPSDAGVEFGSGRSTIWFAKRLGRLTSIENDGAWHAHVATLIEDAGLSSKVDYRKCEDRAEYARQAETFADRSIDFCLVDGIARAQCTRLMIPKLRPGGMLVIDNVERYLPNDWSRSPNTRRAADGCKSPLWEEIGATISSWRRIWTSNGVSDTCIWFVP